MGWAQVHGRNELPWDQKFERDLWYVENRSALVDLRILLLTFACVVARDGIRQSGRATTEPFRGVIS
jgi:sugar transferase EpsL